MIIMSNSSRRFLGNLEDVQKGTELIRLNYSRYESTVEADGCAWNREGTEGI